MDVDDKNLAMVLVAMLAGACLAAEAYGVQVSSATSNVISQVVTGLMGAAVGKALSERQKQSDG